ncbi:MAG: hypothetical protein C5S38_08945 [Candidatus Methanophagaceae archaeon]|nr:MAG: hypothetical protein C5S38_08945 [Methanophagales archaeon]KAF5430438.1 hypothetical protein C5S36_13075 [Methanophagales archaeon]
MNRSGVVDLPLHGGSAPYWLVKRMKGLAHAMFGLIVDEDGVDGLIEKLADPLWFQSLSCVLAYDWHSSGTTTVVCGVLKSVIVPEEFGISIAGGKGKASKNTLSDIDTIGDKMGFSDSKIAELKYASRISAKVDNACVQDGYQLYHHSMIISEKGEWAVIQQGMNPRNQFARRYHWLSSAVKRYEEEPHKGIVGVRQEEEVLDMTSKASRGCKETSLDLVKAGTGELERLYKELGGGKRIRAGQRTLFNFEDATKDAVNVEYEKSKVYKLPKRVNWDAFRVAYDRQPANYEQFLGVRGVGPAAVRALSLISELIYGEKPSWRDPVKYSFAFGGKDGVPYPVDRRTMDETTVILREVVKEAREKVKTIC